MISIANLSNGNLNQLKQYIATNFVLASPRPPPKKKLHQCISPGKEGGQEPGRKGGRSVWEAGKEREGKRIPEVEVVGENGIMFGWIFCSQEVQRCRSQNNGWELGLKGSGKLGTPLSPPPLPNFMILMLNVLGTTKLQ